MMKSPDRKEANDISGLGAAKRRVLEAVVLDLELPRLAGKIIALFTMRYMWAAGGGVAFPGVDMICNDLEIPPSSERHVRRALRQLVRREHLVCQRSGTNHYVIHPRHFADEDNRAIFARWQAHSAKPRERAKDAPPSGQISPAQPGKFRPNHRAKIAHRIHDNESMEGNQVDESMMDDSIIGTESAISTSRIVTEVPDPAPVIRSSMQQSGGKQVADTPLAWEIALQDCGEFLQALSLLTFKPRGFVAHYREARRFVSKEALLEIAQKDRARADSARNAGRPIGSNPNKLLSDLIISGGGRVPSELEREICLFGAFPEPLEKAG